MNKKCKWIKSASKVIIVLFIWLSACFFIWKQSGIQIGNKIEVLAIWTLVIITGIYAYQTHRIVKEEIKRREAEFGHTRIKDFYSPLLNELQKLRESLNKMQINVNNANEIRDIDKEFKAFDSFRYNNSYLATSMLAQKLLQFCNQIKERWITGPAIRSREARENWRDDFLRKTGQAILSANEEFRSIMIHLRKTYGYFLGEE